MMKKQNGITLIALVITIIVLLILAGVSIAMLTGDNGILTKAKTTQDASDRGEVMERVNMELNAQMANAMAGDKFDEATTIAKNLGATAENAKTVTIGKYTITVADTVQHKAATTTPAADEVEGIVSISISGGDATTAFTPSTGTVKYTTANGATITPIKLAK